MAYIRGDDHARVTGSEVQCLVSPGRGVNLEMRRDERPADSNWLLDNSTDAASVEKYYDEWSARYDCELSEWDYRSPDETARLLARYAAPCARVLDAGCGTGLSGRALVTAGFKTIVGVDISAESLEIASKRGIYDELRQMNLQALPLPLDNEVFDALTCVGVLTYLDDTANTLREFCRLVRSGGHVVFTCRDDLYLERDFPTVMQMIVSEGRWRKLYESPPSPYLPGNDGFGEHIQVIYAVFEVAG